MNFFRQDQKPTWMSLLWLVAGVVAAFMIEDPMPMLGCFIMSQLEQENE